MVNPIPRARRERRCVLAGASPTWGVVGAPQQLPRGQRGNRMAKALGTWVRLGRIGKPTGRNTCEASASLESDVVRVDLLFGQGRPPDCVGATDQ